MEKPYINHLAVFVCALLSLVVGGLWYGLLGFYLCRAARTGVHREGG